ncbi:MAG: hypothetical protein Q4G08_09370 [Capnocytophaga sp.]|nr:hypothetical protein [Capnocytophaga sp.]
MRKTLRNGLLTIVFTANSVFVNAQQAETIVETSAENITEKTNTIANQFNDLISKSSTYQNYKVIDRNKLAILQKNIADSINAYKKELDARQSAIRNSQTEINSLNANINDLQADLDQTRDEKDSFSFFGLLMPKSTYSAIMWTLVLGLGGLLAFYIFRFGKSNVVTQKSLADLNELQDEYENYRKSAIERDQKVRRQLQDEINKNKDTK